VGLAYAPEERKKDALFLDRSVLENVTIAANRKLAHRRFLRRAEQVRMAEDLRQRLRIKTHSLKTPIRNLSGGNQQKVVLARLIATGPRLLVLDEPTRGIDVGAKQEIYELIEQMTREGMGVLLISSELPELLALSDRVVVIREGRSVAELPGTEATEEVVLALSMPSSTDDLSATGAA
jgi:L-arabinose transport system ATP-binding protein